MFSYEAPEPKSVDDEPVSKLALATKTTEVKIEPTPVDVQTLERKLFERDIH